MRDMLESIDEQATITDLVYETEALSVYETSGDPPKARRIDLQLLVNLGLLLIVSPDTEVEQNSFVDFAAVLDDGEALTGAVAGCRDWAIATDDKKARRVFRERLPHVQLISTPELVKHWVDNAEPPPDVVVDVLRSIEIGAQYRPSPGDPLSNWWRGFTEG
jgi:hypothetical protein